MTLPRLPKRNIRIRNKWERKGQEEVLQEEVQQPRGRWDGRAQGAVTGGCPHLGMQDSVLPKGSVHW